MAYKLRITHLMASIQPAASDKRGVFRTGTSNVVLPERNKSFFPPAFQSKTHLEYYASLFNSVEINRTFYKLPLPATLGKWAAQVPEDFRFTVKLWKEITHVKELRYKTEDVRLFMQTVAPVGLKKGCLLIQFPAGLSSRNIGSLERLLADITDINPSPGWRLAVELRNRSWYVPVVRGLLDRYGAGWVYHDMPMGGQLEGEQEAELMAGDAPGPPGAADANFIFLRYHGPKGDYKGGYAPEFLEREAVAIKGWLEQGKDVYAYFNNTVDADAPKDAQTLRRFVES